MFKIAIKPTYFYPVVVEIPGDGKPQKYTFEVEFARQTQDELKTIHEQVKSGELTDEQLVKRVLVGWRAVQDEDENELQFSETNRDMLLNIYPVQPSVINAFFTSISAARAKN